MRTTIDINDAKLEELRRLSQKENRSFRAVVDEILALGLAVANRSHKKRQPVEIPTHPLNRKPGFGGMSLNQLYDQIEAEAVSQGEK